MFPVVRPRSLAQAVKLRDHSAVREFLENGADPNKPERGRLLPICYAVLNDDLVSLRQLLNARAKPEGLVERSSLLTAAARGCSASLIRALLDAGADPLANSPDGITPMMCIADRDGFPEDVEVAKLLIMKGVAVNAHTSRNAPALHLAALKGKTELVRLLLSCGALVVANGKRNEIAATTRKLGHIEIADMLERASSAK